MLERDFNNYIANLGVMIFKLHNIHWNVEGPQFVAVHEFTESLYDEIFEYYDAVAEHLKIYSASPDVKMSDYLKNASIKTLKNSVSKQQGLGMLVTMKAGSLG